jgi:hypothetical protein
VAAVDIVDAYVAELRGDGRRLAHAEWGISLRPEAAGGHALDMSVRIDGGLLRAQAFALPAQDGIDPWLLLHWNRQTRFVRMACSRSRDIWVHGELPAAVVDEQALDRLLGLIVEGAIALRRYAATIS